MIRDHQHQRLFDTRVNLLLERVKNSRIPALGAVFLVSILLSFGVGIVLAVTWAVVVVVAYGLRDLCVWLTVQKPWRQTHEYPENSDSIVSWSSAALTFPINFPAAAFLPHLSPEIGSLYIVVMVGWLIIAVHIIGIHTKSYGLYVFVAFAYLSIGWWQMYDPVIAAGAALSLVGAGWILVSYSRSTSQVFQESVQIAHAKDANLEALQGTFVKAANAQRERSQSLASTAHDILQPAQALVLLLSVLKSNPSEKIRKEALENAVLAADAVIAMFRGLLDLSRLDTDAAVEPFKNTTLLPLLESVKAICASACEEHSIELEVECEEDIRVYGGTEMIERVLLNLVDNAVKYTPDGGYVFVKVQQARERVEISITDTGIGIPESEQASILEPFYRSTSVPGDVEGVGLGLTNSARFVELMGGELQIDSTVGEGTTIKVALPSAQTLAIEDVQPVAPPGHSSRESVSGKSVLILEDSLRARVALTLCLLNRDAFPIPAASFEEAMRHVEGGFAPDILLVDLHLGEGYSGAECISLLRPKTGDIPVVLTTASLFDIEQLPENVKVLRKPFSNDQLIEMLEYR